MTRYVLLAFLCIVGTAHAQVYTRFDFGYSKSVNTDLHDKDFASDGVICGDATCSSPGNLKDVGSGFLIGGGVGNQFTEHVRLDVTLTYRAGYKLDKSDSFNPPAHYSADVSSLAFMANGYWDFPLGGWAPYAGLGLGFASNTMGSMNFGDNAGFSGSTSSKTSTSGAFAFMLGAGVPLGSGPVLDFGYRYADLGKLETGSGVQRFGGGTFPYAGATGKLRAHELTVGMRF
jgi:opacity protein-like surface antigen